ncbi:MAG: ATP-dependent DNA helicase [Candidatus Peribacteraceae bacterium]|jgi:DNA helicase-2/ATP-dependent DNA helicase PcrA
MVRYDSVMPKAAERKSSDSTNVKQRKEVGGVPSFQKAYGSLTQAQRDAVDAIEGPVMVVAGPGTGKTHVLSLRVANILKRTQMRPSNILCLTFSVSAATEMRERLRAYIGSDAYGVTVRNFHSFCNELIAEHPLVFDDWSALEQISDVERVREVNKIIDQLLPDCVLVNKKQPYLRTREIIGRIGQLKREGVTDTEELTRIADQYEQDMASKSKEGTKVHEKNLLSARKFRELLEVFVRYQEMLERTQRYDYEDMILYVNRALEEHDWLLASLQERYQYILVDEFQDTNGAQYRLVELLTTYPTVDHEPNLFVVGDDDQAIYRFQGANLQNILSFHTRFPKAPIIVLTESFRCTQEILDAAGGVIANNTERLVGRIEGLQKDLTAFGKKHGVQPQLFFAPSDMTEPWMLADIITERLKKTPAEEIAILVQTNSELLPYYDVLTACGIPVQMTGKVDLLHHPLVQQVIAILRAVENPANNAALAGALGCACFACHPADLGRLYARRRDDDVTVQSLLLSLDEPDGEPVPLQNTDAVIHARDVLLDLHNKVASRTVVDTLEHIIKDSGLLAFAKGKTEADFDPVSFAALQEFFERLKLRAYEQPHFTFQQFLSDLEYYEAPEYPDLRMSYSLPHLTEKGVRLMTAHQSKGMEFAIVILANFRDGHWDRRRNHGGVAMPEDLLFGWQKDQRAYEKNQDERRVAFVAMTRAKQELIFSCPKELTTGDKTREVSPSAFFAEAGTLPEVLHTLTEPERASVLLHTPPTFDGVMEAFLRERLENYALSVTALNHFLEDPQMFLELDILQTPQAKKSSLIYGNAVHDALRQWALAVQEGEPLSREAFLTAFRRYLTEREILTEAERARLTAVGEDALPRYYDAQLAGTSPVIYRVEYPITTFFGDIPIRGKIDRIDLLAPDTAPARVIDFKTGRPKTEKQIRDDGNYFRQLAFYALLLECKNTPIEPVEYALEFIGEGSEHPVTRSFQITQTELEELKQTVQAVWQKVTALDFTS